ncbi:MAG: hypothetical protein WC926_00210 [Candidatus Paceibacterota bacterium]|jgi:hypothetical protein
MDINVVGQKQSKKNKSVVFWIFLAVLFLILFGQNSPVFMVALVILYFYLKFSGNIKWQTWSKEGDVIEEAKSYLFDPGAENDPIPSPWQNTNMPPVKVKHSYRSDHDRAVESEWKQRGKNEDSDEYWRARVEEKTSGGAMFKGIAKRGESERLG